MAVERYLHAPVNIHTRKMRRNCCQPTKLAGNLAPKEKKAYNTRKTDNQSSLESLDERNPLFEVVMWHVYFVFS